MPLLFLLAVTLGACSATTGSSAPAVSSAPSAGTGASAPASGSEVCAAVASLKSALSSLKDLDLKAVGTNGLTTAVDAVQTAAANLATALTGGASPELTAFQTSLADLKATVSGLSSDASVVEKASAIRTAIKAVQAAGSDLEAAIPDCS